MEDFFDVLFSIFMVILSLFILFMFVIGMIVCFHGQGFKTHKPIIPERTITCINEKCDTTYLYKETK